MVAPARGGYVDTGSESTIGSPLTESGETDGIS